jgi:BMFP domain-containing protein YqiC
MEKKKIFDDLQSRVSQIIDGSPVKDIEKNLRALMTQALSRLDVITREEFELQTQVVEQLRKQMIMLHDRLKTLEKQNVPSDDKTV